jgi:hypothetical protein
MKIQFVYSLIVAVAFLSVSLFPGCKNEDKEADYTDYGTSVFMGVADAGQAGLDTTAATGDPTLKSANARFIGTFDNNSWVFSAQVIWTGFPNAAKKAQVFAPADSGVFLNAYSDWDINTSLTGILGSVYGYRMESSMLTDNEKTYLKAGKWYFTLTTTSDLTSPARTTTGAHTLSVAGVQKVGYGIVRGQIKWLKTFFKSKPTCYYIPYAVSDSASTAQGTAVSGNLAANDFPSNSLTGSGTITSISNTWSLVSDNSVYTVYNDKLNSSFTFNVKVPFAGTAVVNADGTFTYTPNTGFTGTDYFLYRITDANGNKSQLAYVKITVK